MKILKNTLFALLATTSLVFYSCNNEEVATPQACFGMYDASGNEIGEAKVNQPVTFKICDHNPALLAVWTGDVLYTPLKTKDGKKDSVDVNGNVVMAVKERHVYADYGKAFPGEPVSRTKGVTLTKDATKLQYPDFTYSYPKPGTYTVSVVATNSGEMAENVKTGVSEKQIVITP